MDLHLWIAAACAMSAVVAILIAVGERGEKRELAASRDFIRAECDMAWAERDRERARANKAEGTLTRILLNDDNRRTVDDAEIVPVSFEERAG